MSADFERFLKLSDQERRDVFEAAADRLDTLPSYVEKDFWVCFVLDLLFNRMPKGHPRLLFKGGTALSKAFGLIQRFSEDIDLVVYREGLGFGPDRDPTSAPGLTSKQRKGLFDELKDACSAYICGILAPLCRCRLVHSAKLCRTQMTATARRCRSSTRRSIPTQTFSMFSIA